MQPSTRSAVVAHRRQFYSPELRERWHGMWAAWLASRRTDSTVWQEYERLLDVPGFRFREWRGGRFAESVVALDLLEHGYAVFRAAMLFPYGKVLGAAETPTRLVEALLAETQRARLRTASLVRPRLRNPDLAAVHAVHGWRFSEVKWKHGDRPRPGQLEALAVLQDVLGATVEIVRVVPEEERGLPDPPPYSCSYTLT